MVENIYSSFVTTEGKRIDISECETLSDVIEQLYEYIPYTASEYIENFLPNASFKEDGSLDAEKLSEDEIFKCFVNADKLNDFNASKNVVVLVGCGEKIFLMDDEKTEVELLEDWLKRLGSFEK